MIAQGNDPDARVAAPRLLDLVASVVQLLRGVVAAGPMVAKPKAQCQSSAPATTPDR